MPCTRAQGAQCGLAGDAEGEADAVMDERLKRDVVEKLESRVTRLELVDYLAELEGRIDDRTKLATAQRSYKMGCKLTGPGRGDCIHFVGMPPSLEYPKHVDEYGIPHNWCDYCWMQHQMEIIGRA